MRWIVAAGFCVTGCSFITDLSPATGGPDGVGGMSGSGGISASGGMSGSGGHPDAAPDAHFVIDAAADARPDAALTCTSSLECDDGLACTADRCAFPGLCQHLPNDSVCTSPNLCTIDVCNPTGDMPDPCGCTHTFRPCFIGEICMADLGCVSLHCNATNPCPEPADCCMIASCENERCNQIPKCSIGQRCVYVQDPQCLVPTSCVCQ
jgi:hypothetical protein